MLDTVRDPLFSGFQIPDDKPVADCVDGESSVRGDRQTMRLVAHADPAQAVSGVAVRIDLAARQAFRPRTVLEPMERVVPRDPQQP